MTIQFHCEHCGKLVEAPDEAGGKRGKCPYCHLGNFIPPAESGEELDLAPLDEDFERQRKEEINKLLDAERDLLDETSHTEQAPRLSQKESSEISAVDLHHHVVNYCLDMFAGNLERAETHVDRLRQHRRLAQQAVADFLSGHVLEPALDKVPVKLQQGFLKTLSDQLREQ